MQRSYQRSLFSFARFPCQLEGYVQILLSASIEFSDPLRKLFSHAPGMKTCREELTKWYSVNTQPIVLCRHWIPTQDDQELYDGHVYSSSKSDGHRRRYCSGFSAINPWPQAEFLRGKLSYCVYLYGVLGTSKFIRQLSQATYS